MNGKEVKWIKRLKHIIIFVYHRKKLPTETLEITRLLYDIQCLAEIVTVY